MGNPRPKTEYLAEKLLAVRQHLKLSQGKMAKEVGVPREGHISAFESGRREPHLAIILRYARAANISVECLIDDEMDLPFGGAIVGRKPRPKPQGLATKLLAIRQNLGLTQFEMAQKLEFRWYARLSEYESGRREPNLLLLLRYARLAGITVEELIDDSINWP